MRILHTADFHHNLGWFDWLIAQQTKFDLLVLAGDLLDMRAPGREYPLSTQVKAVRKKLAALKTPAAVCTGNHDIWMTNPIATDVWAEGGWLKNCRRENLWIDGDTFKFMDEHIAVVKYNTDRWPARATIVVVHNPPKNLKTAVSAGNKIDFGSHDVARDLVQNRPDFILCGHVHNPVAWMDSWENTTVLNPGFGTGAAPNHIIIDTESREIIRVSAETKS
jgi:Icc-related predicted phosphoesterase